MIDGTLSSLAEIQKALTSLSPSWIYALEGLLLTIVVLGLFVGMVAELLGPHLETMLRDYPSSDSN